MAGHSKWKQIKHKKGIADQKRGQLFSKLLNAVAIAARQDPNPQFNPRLRAAIEKAKQSNVPQENIERAVKKASENKNLEELTIEAYGPGGAALIIEAISDNKNRTINEIKKLLNEKGGKIGEPGSVRWAFSAEGGEEKWKAKFNQEIAPEDKSKLDDLTRGLENHNDVQKVYTNIGH